MRTRNRHLVFTCHLVSKPLGINASSIPKQCYHGTAFQVPESRSTRDFGINSTLPNGEVRRYTRLAIPERTQLTIQMGTVSNMSRSTHTNLYGISKLHEHVFGRRKLQTLTQALLRRQGKAIIFINVCKVPRHKEAR